MDDRLRAAAESLRSTVPMLVKIGVGKVRSTNEDTLRALLIVADAYLAEHPADDAEPVTDEWLRSVLGDSKTADLGWGFSVDFYESWHPDLVYANDGYPRDAVLPDCKTRGDVRRLCAALGIEPIRSCEPDAETA